MCLWRGTRIVVGGVNDGDDQLRSTRPAMACGEEQSCCEQSCVNSIVPMAARIIVTMQKYQGRNPLGAGKARHKVRVCSPFAVREIVTGEKMAVTFVVVHMDPSLLLWTPDAPIVLSFQSSLDADRGRRVRFVVHA